MKCPECGEKAEPQEVSEVTEERLCRKCGKWSFYGHLATGTTGGGTMKPDDGTEQAKREYDGTAKYRR